MPKQAASGKTKVNAFIREFHNEFLSTPTDELFCKLPIERKNFVLLLSDSASYMIAAEIGTPPQPVIRDGERGLMLQ